MSLPIQQTPVLNPLPPSSGDTSHEASLDPSKLATAREIYANHPTQENLGSMTIPVLKALCFEKGISLPTMKVGRKQLKKSEIIDIMISFLVSSLTTMVLLTFTDLARRKTRIAPMFLRTTFPPRLLYPPLTKSLEIGILMRL